MTFKEIQELIKLINKTDLSEFKVRDGEFELSIRTKNYVKKAIAAPLTTAMPIAASMPVGPAPTNEAVAPSNQDEGNEATQETSSNLVEVKSPIVGTFYRSPGPEKDVFVKVGDSINTGDVVCIIEAMKLFNEIESEVSGKIVKVLIEDASPVEYDQVLFLVDPNG